MRFLISLAVVWLLGVACAVAQELPPPPCGPSDLRAVLSTRTLPAYPTLSQTLQEEGASIIQVTVDEEGKVVGAELARSSGFDRLDQAALDHVKAQWRWEPGKHQCPTTRVQINWNLKDTAPPNAMAINPATMLKVIALLPMPQGEYPADALAAKAGGSVGIAVMLSDQGEVLKAMVANSSGHPSLDARALEIVKSQHGWTPPRMDGKPVGAVLLVTALWFPPGTPVPSPEDIKAMLELRATLDAVPSKDAPGEGGR